jgi:hypothetical protein
MRKLHYFISRWFIPLMLSFAAMPVFAGGAVPVMVGGVAKLDACGGLGEVRGLNQSGDGFLAVRMGPGSKYPMIDRLYNGNQVYFCASHGKWIGIVYGKPAQDCGLSSPLPKRQPYKGPCQSGWAHRNWLALIAG